MFFSQIKKNVVLKNELNSHPLNPPTISHLPLCFHSFLSSPNVLYTLPTAFIPRHQANHSRTSKAPLTPFMSLLLPGLTCLCSASSTTCLIHFLVLLWWCCHGNGSGEINPPSPVTCRNYAFLFLIRTMDSLSVLHQAVMWLQLQWKFSSPFLSTKKAASRVLLHWKSEVIIFNCLPSQNNL